MMRLMKRLRRCGLLSRVSIVWPGAALAALSAMAQFAIASGVPAHTAVTPRHVVPGDLASPMSGLSQVDFHLYGKEYPCLLLKSDGGVTYFGARAGSTVLDSSSIAPDGPFTQVVGSAVLGFGRRPDGSVIGWPSTAPGTAPPPGTWADISCWGSGVAGVKVTGQLRIWGTFVFPMPSGDPGPYVDAEVSPLTVVARRTDGGLVQFGIGTGAPDVPRGAFVEHQMGGDTGGVLGIARRADGSLTTWGGIGAPTSFLQRAYSTCRVGGRLFGGIAASDGALWVGFGAIERRFEGPFRDAAFSDQAFYGLTPDGRVVKQLVTETDPVSNGRFLLNGPDGPRLRLSEYPQPVSIVRAGNPNRPNTFLLGQDGTVRLLDGAAWPGMRVEDNGVIWRDVVELTPISNDGSRGGALIALKRDGTLCAYSAWPNLEVAMEPVPYSMPSGVFRKFVGEVSVGAERWLFAIDAQGRLVRWAPTQIAPTAEVIFEQCSAAAGETPHATSGDSSVVARDAAGVWHCFGAPSILCDVPPTAASRFSLPGYGHGFAQDGSGAVLQWGSSPADPAPAGPVREFGVQVFPGYVLGCSITRAGALQSWGFNPPIANPWSLGDAHIAAGGIVQSGSQCTLRVGISDCDGDGISDWDEIAAAGSSGDCNDNGIPDSCDIAAGGADIDGDGILDACEMPVVGDLNGDRLVNAQDLAQLLSMWGAKQPSVADLNGDGLVNALDVAILLSAWR